MKQQSYLAMAVLAFGGAILAQVGWMLHPPQPYSVLGVAIGGGFIAIPSWMLLADEIHTKKRIPAMMVLAVWAVLMTGLFFGIATLNVTLGFLAAGLAAFVVIALMARALTRK